MPFQSVSPVSCRGTTTCSRAGSRGAGNPTCPWRPFRHDVKGGLPHSRPRCVSRHPKTRLESQRFHPRLESVRRQVRECSNAATSAICAIHDRGSAGVRSTCPGNRVINNEGEPPAEAPATSVARTSGTGSPLPATTPRFAISFSRSWSRPKPPGYCRSTTKVRTPRRSTVTRCTADQTPPRNRRKPTTRLLRPIDAATQARVSTEGRRCKNPPALRSSRPASRNRRR